MNDDTDSTVASEEDGLNILDVTRRQLDTNGRVQNQGKSSKTKFRSTKGREGGESPRRKGKSSRNLGDESTGIDEIDDVSQNEEDESDDSISQHRDQLSHGRIDWSDNEASDEAYQKFKKRKSLKRKREAALNRKARGVKTGKKNSKAQPGRDKEKENQSSDEDDNLHDLPDYLQQRRARFEKRKEKLKEAGLKLPPSYDEVTFSDDDDLASLQEKPDFPTSTPPAQYKDRQLPFSLGVIPAPIAQWLRDYQIQGVAFLHKLFVFQGGGILGDDMGLGKTVQVIAFLTAAFGKTGDERDSKRMRKMRRANVKWYPRVLVVCPGTLIENWKAELQRWGWWHVDVYHGSHKDSILETAMAGRLEILITTYTTYRGNKSAINMIEWDCVVADECHQIKGRNSESTKAMNEVNALCRIGLTGTAIQNNYDELWTLLNWANPGRFGPIATWRTSISEPLKIGQSHAATIHQLGKARKTAKALVSNLLPQFFLRRMKTLIAHQLPKKSDRVVFCPLTGTQAQAYKTVLDSDLVETIRTSSDPCTCGSNKKSGWCCNTTVEDGSKWQSWVFPIIITLEKIANHLAILIPQSQDLAERQEKELEMLKRVLPDEWRDLYHTRNSMLNYSNSEFCGKWKVLRRLLTFWHANGDKVLVFSHSVRLLKMLRLLFQNTSYSVSYLDGSLSYEDRAKAVDDFNADADQFVFLISTKAGGIGLNITAANKVVIVDPNWNPSWDLQAQDRAYRIGQTRDVEVFRLVSAGTIEEIVYARQIYKQQQANIGYTASKERRYFSGVQDRVEQKGEIFGLQNLFAYVGDSVVLRDIVHKTNVAEDRAGVDVMGVDLSGFDPHRADGEDGQGDMNGDDPLVTSGSEGDVMSQIADMIAAGDGPEASTAAAKSEKRAPKKRSDPVQAILAGTGVAYTHENSEVIGSSKVEAHLSRKAVEVGNDIGEGEMRLFLDEHEVKERRRGADTGEPEWKYRPPVDVMQRQFCSMAKEFGFEDATEFALVVEGWTQAQRRTCLDIFYRQRRETLGIGRRTDIGDEEL